MQCSKIIANIRKRGQNLLLISELIPIFVFKNLFNDKIIAK